jgi:hypothetical protein
MTHEKTGEEGSGHDPLSGRAKRFRLQGHAVVISWPARDHVLCCPNSALGPLPSIRDVCSQDGY